MGIHKSHIFLSFFVCAVKIVGVNVLTLPGGRVIDIPDTSHYKYHITSEEDKNSTILRNYLLIEVRPNTALLCPKNYHIQKVKQELFVSRNVTGNDSNTLTFHSLAYGEKKDKDSIAPCPTIYRCLGFQACLFKFGNEFCTRDPMPNFRKMLVISVTCQKDSYPWLMKLVLDEHQGRLSANRNQVLHLRYSSKLEVKNSQERKDYIVTDIREVRIPEDEVFGAECPPVDVAVKHVGYGGNCSQTPANPIDIVEQTWTLLGRTSTKTCREELNQVFCAFQYNRRGTCIPGFLMEKVDLAGPQADLVPVRLAFILMLHKDIPAAIQLLKMVWRKHHLYVIHIDKRVEESRQILETLLKEEGLSVANVVILPQSRSFATAWGSYEIIRAQLEGMEELLRLASWDFVINLSGADLPLRDVDDLAAALAPHRGLNFLPFAQVRNGPTNDDEDNRPGGLSRDAFYCCDDYVFNVSSTAGMPDLKDLQVFNSPQWGVFSKEFAEFLVNENRRPDATNKFQFYLQTHVIPDESYISTLLMNSPFRTTLRRYAVHVSNEFVADNADHLCRHFTDADFCGQGPSLFSGTNQKELMSLSHRSFFARKFHGDLFDETRNFALGLARRGYAEFIETFLPKRVVQELAAWAISDATSKGIGIDTNLRLVQTPQVRILPSLVSHDDCCRSILLSGIRKITDHHMWMDINLIDGHNTKNPRTMRTSFIPRINGRTCYGEGHLKMAFISTWTKDYTDEEGDEDESIKFGLQETMPFPYGPAGIRSVSLALVFAHENFSCLDEEKSPDHLPIFVEDFSRPLRLTIRLLAPSSESVCVQRKEVRFTKFVPENATDSEELPPSFFHIHSFLINCNLKLGPGPWTLQLNEELKSGKAKVYNFPFYLLGLENERELEKQLPDVRRLWKIQNLGLVEETEIEGNEAADSSILFNTANRVNLLRWIVEVVFTWLACQGGLLVTVIIGIGLHTSCRQCRLRRRYFFSYVVTFAASSMVQTMLLLRYC